MARPESIAIVRHITVEELNKKIKSLEKDVKVLRRLYFIKYRYEGDGVEESAKKIGISKPVAYIWQDRWNKDGYEGLKPKFAGGKPSKLSDIQKTQLKEKLKERDDWSTEAVRELVFKEFNV
jgi:putative transposase